MSSCKAACLLSIIKRVKRKTIDIYQKYLVIFKVPSGTLPTDSECGATKGCFIDCTGNSCNYIVTWRDNGDAVDFELSTKLQDTNNKWIAIGFSSDLKMV